MGGSRPGPAAVGEISDLARSVCDRGELYTVLHYHDNKDFSTSLL